MFFFLVEDCLGCCTYLYKVFLSSFLQYNLLFIFFKYGHVMFNLVLSKLYFGYIFKNLPNFYIDYIKPAQGDTIFVAIEASTILFLKLFFNCVSYRIGKTAINCVLQSIDYCNQNRKYTNSLWLQSLTDNCNHKLIL